MKATTENARFKGLVENTISTLCQHSLKFEQEYSIEGLLVITVDKKESFNIHIKEQYGKAAAVDSPSPKKQAITSNAKPPVPRNTQAPVDDQRESQSSGLRKRRSVTESEQQEKKVKSEERTTTRSKTVESGDDKKVTDSDVTSSKVTDRNVAVQAASKKQQADVKEKTPSRRGEHATPSRRDEPATPPKNSRKTRAHASVSDDDDDDQSRRDASSSSPAVTTRSARKQAALSARIATRSSGPIRTPPTHALRKPYSLLRRPKTEPRPSTMRAATTLRSRTVKVDTSSSPRTPTRSAAAKKSESAKEVAVKTESPEVKSKEQTSAKTAEKPSKVTPKSTASSAAQKSNATTSKQKEASSKETASTSKDQGQSKVKEEKPEVKPTTVAIETTASATSTSVKTTCETVLIDTRGSIQLQRTPVTSTPKASGASVSTPTSQPLLVNVPQLLSLDKLSFARKAPVIGDVKAVRSADRSSGDIDDFRVEVFKQKVAAITAAAEEGEAEDAGDDDVKPDNDSAAMKASDLSPNALNNVVEQVVTSLNEQAKIKTTGERSTIKVNLGLGAPRVSFSNPLKCRRCSTEFASLEIQAHHACATAQQQPPEAAVLYKCELCQAMFLKEVNLHKHCMDIHNAIIA